MARSKIEWLARPDTIPESWSPISGCDPDDGHQSEACVHCWARRMSKRLAGRAGYDAEHPFHITAHKDKLCVPYRWRKPRTVFVVSMGDLFHSAIAWQDIERVFEVMVHCRKHTFILCTKRAERMYDFITTCYPGLDQCCPHIWGLVTAETQERANQRIPWLFRTPFAVRGVSVEPMLGPVTLFGFGSPTWGKLPPRAFLNWVICGAETGPGARPMLVSWAGPLLDQCLAAGVPYFFKRGSDGERTLDGKEWHQWPMT